MIAVQPTRRVLLHGLFAGAWIVALACLFMQGWGEADVQGAAIAFGVAMSTASTLAASCAVLVALWLRGRDSAGQDALLVPCAIAPLAVLGPWTIAPSRLGGVAIGHFPFFLAWLTRYPNVGSINYEVLLGIGAMLGACSMPAFFALYALNARSARPVILGMFVALSLIAYVPVFIRLDVPQIAFALMVARDAPTSVLTALSIMSGALSRLLAMISMIVWSYRTRRISEVRAHRARPET